MTTQLPGSSCQLPLPNYPFQESHCQKRCVFHVCVVPSPLLHFSMFPTLHSTKCAHGSHLELHSQALREVRWLSDERNTQGNLACLRCHCPAVDRDFTEINVSLTRRGSFFSLTLHTVSVPTFGYVKWNQKPAYCQPGISILQQQETNMHKQV